MLGAADPGAAGIAAAPRGAALLSIPGVAAEPSGLASAAARSAASEGGRRAAVRRGAVSSAMESEFDLVAVYRAGFGRARPEYAIAAGSAAAAPSGLAWWTRRSRCSCARC